MTENWFEDWFNSPYYHILYKNRDEQEAERFMQNLVSYLKLNNDTKILDLACGKGRHSVFLNKMGLDVTGIDLSEENILEAKKHENATLNFYVQDMRLPFRINYYNCTLNLFTSFGYFKKISDNNKVIQAVYKGLHKKGMFVLDFFNSKKIEKEFIASETKNISGINFNISKKIENNCIIKTIQFIANGTNYSYSEKVNLFSKETLISLLEKNGFSIDAVFGDYEMNAFDIEKSPRLVLIAKKI